MVHVHDAFLSLKPFSFPRRCAKLKRERKSWELGESGRILSSLFCFVLCGKPREGGNRQKMKKKNGFFDFFFKRPEIKTHTHTTHTVVKGERTEYYVEHRLYTIIVFIIIIIIIYVCTTTLTLKHKFIITPECVSLIKFIPQKR